MQKKTYIRLIASMLISWGSAQALGPQKTVPCDPVPLIKVAAECKESVAADGSLARICFDAAKCGGAGLTSLACGIGAVGCFYFGLLTRQRMATTTLGKVTLLSGTLAFAYTAWDSFNYSTDILRSLLPIKKNE